MVVSNDLTVGWQNLNPLSHPNADVVALKVQGGSPCDHIETNESIGTFLLATLYKVQLIYSNIKYINI